MSSPSPSPSPSHSVARLKTKSPKKERSLEMCVRVSYTEFMWFSIPNITTALDDIFSSSRDASSKPFYVHSHNLEEEEQPRPLHPNYDIIAKRFRVIPSTNNDNFKGPFPFPFTTKDTVIFYSDVIGSTVFCVGGDPSDIPGYHDIMKECDPSYPTPSNITDVDVPVQPVVKGICHNIWTFDLSNPTLGWSQGKPLISPRLYPVFFAYQGKLYAFGGNHPSHIFAEVYDPLSQTWFPLPPAPFGRLSFGSLIVIPLKGWNKIWVFARRHAPLDYTFDVLTKKWEKFRGSVDILPHLLPDFPDFSNFVSALTPSKHMIVYWMNYQDTVFAYDLSSNQLFKGKISGEDDLEYLLAVPMSLHHLYRDIFCVIGITHHSGYSGLKDSCNSLEDSCNHSGYSLLHVMILQISIKTSETATKAPLESCKSPSRIRKIPTYPLTAGVLGCFAYRLEGDVDFYESYIMSKSR